MKHTPATTEVKNKWILYVPYQLCQQSTNNFWNVELNNIGAQDRGIFVHK